MPDVVAIWAALIGAVAYGSGDFLGGFATRRLSTLTTVAIAQTVAAAFMVQNFHLSHGSLPAGGQLSASILSGFATSLALMALYGGFAQGRIAIVAPICAVFSIVVPLLGDIMLARCVSPAELAGIACCAGAVLMVAGAAGGQGPGGFVARSVRSGVASGIAFGISDVCLGTMPPDHAAGALLVARCVAAILAVAAALVQSRRGPALHTMAIGAALELSRSGTAGQVRAMLARPPVAIGLALAAGAGAFDAIGHIGYVHAATRGHMGVAAALVAVFPIVTVLLAVLVFRERITRAQLVGFAIGGVGILFIAD